MNSDQTMQAVVIEEFGEPSELKGDTRSVPIPGPGEVLIEVKAAGVNRSDLLNIRGLPITTLPRVPGRDFAGIVVAGDPELRGESVWGVGGSELGFSRDGSHAEYLTLPRTAVAPMPHALSFADAAAAGLPYLTAAIALLELADVAGGKRSSSPARPEELAGRRPRSQSGEARR